MFGLFTRKKQKPIYTQIDPTNIEKDLKDFSLSLDMKLDDKKCLTISDVIDKYIQVEDNFPRVDWQGITDVLEEETQNSDLNISEFWSMLVKAWLVQMSEYLDDAHGIYESEHFYILSSASDNHLNIFVKYLESVQSRIHRALPGIVQYNERGKFVVLLLDNIELYYSYISHYYPQNGEFSMSSGVFLSGGYGHFVVPHNELDHVEAVAAHELTHAMLAHLPIPLWLNEGLAVNMESSITGYSSYQLNSQKHNKHLGHWNEQTIQDFWSGESFQRAGDAVELSYHLAQLIVQSLAENYEVLQRFVNQADFIDGGESAAIEVFGGSLGAIIEQIYGDGEWSPKPYLWSEASS